MLLHLCDAYRNSCKNALFRDFANIAKQNQQN